MGIRRSLHSAMVGALLALLLPPAVQARIWEGRGQLEVRVRSSEGGPVSGAEVELLFLEAQPPSGPPLETTGPRGRATISGLAGGTWSIRVRHRDHLTYGARLEIEIGRKVEELQAFHQSEGEGTGILRIDYEKIRRGPPPPPRSSPSPPPSSTAPPSDRPEGAESPGAPPPETEPTSREVPPEEAAPDRRGEESPSAERRLSSEDRESQPARPSPESPPGTEASEEPTPTPTDEVQEEDSDLTTATTPSPKAGPSKAESPETASGKEPPETRREKKLPPQAPEEGRGEGEEAIPEEIEEPGPPGRDRAPTSEPPTAPAPEEIPTPTAESSSPPRPEARIRSASGSTCPDCRPGEAALSVDVRAAPGGSEGACPEDARNRAREAIGRLVASLGPGTSSFHGPLSDPTLRDLLSLGSPEGRTTARSSLGALLSPGSACRLLAIVLPADAEFTGFRYEARGVEGSGDCLPERACPIGDARWLGVPERVREGGREVVFGLFLNTSPDRDRHPRLTVYFRR